MSEDGISLVWDANVNKNHVPRICTLQCLHPKSFWTEVEFGELSGHGSHSRGSKWNSQKNLIDLMSFSLLVADLGLEFIALESCRTFIYSDINCSKSILMVTKLNAYPNQHVLFCHAWIFSFMSQKSMVPQYLNISPLSFFFCIFSLLYLL